MRIIDKTGNIYKSLAWYPMVDPISGHTYQPGELVKVDENPWILQQTFMQNQEPVKATAEKPKVQARQTPAAA